MTYKTACKVLALLATSAVAACGSDSGSFSSNGDHPPFGGRVIKFNSTYVYFPTDFSMSIVRDTMPQEDACRLLNQYATSKPPLTGLPILPYTAEHYSLVITVDSVKAGDDVSLDKSEAGGPGDMRYAGVGQYGIGNNRSPLWASRASGVIRISDLTQYQHVGGKFNLQFITGEQLAEDFSIDACTPHP